MRTALHLWARFSGGAGIQADIKTMTRTRRIRHERHNGPDGPEHDRRKEYFGVHARVPAAQLDCVFTDIFPDAVKTGMVSSIPLIEVIADKLSEYGARNIVVDPVMVATSRRQADKRGRRGRAQGAAAAAGHRTDPQHPARRSCSPGRR